MIITQANLEALRTGFDARFKAGLKKSASTYALLATVVPSSTKTATYGWLSTWPRFRKWVGKKKIRSLKEKSYKLVNDSFESTVGIHKDEIKDDNLGLYGPMAEGWGQAAAALPDQLVFDALKNGHATECFDGQNFFDADHPVGDDAGTTYSNMSGNDAVAPWFLMDLSQPLKPIIYQNREAPHFHMVTDMTDSQVFQTGEYLMGGEARGAAGYTFPQLAHRCTNTLNEANWEAARAAMVGLKDEEGDPLEVSPTHIVVGSSNYAAALELFGNEKKANGASNKWYRAVEIIEAKRLA